MCMIIVFWTETAAQVHPELDAEVLCHKFLPLSLVTLLPSGLCPTAFTQGMAWIAEVKETEVEG